MYRQVHAYVYVYVRARSVHVLLLPSSSSQCPPWALLRPFTRALGGFDIRGQPWANLATTEELDAMEQMLLAEGKFDHLFEGIPKH